jgi:hypothetical protein
MLGPMNEQDTEEWLHVCHLMDIGGKDYCETMPASEAHKRTGHIPKDQSHQCHCFVGIGPTKEEALAHAKRLQAAWHNGEAVPLPEI